MLKMSTYRMRAKGLADFLRPSHFIDENTLLNKDGSLTTAFTWRGEGLDYCSDSEQNSLKSQLNQSLMKFGSGWMFHTDWVKVQKNGYPLEKDCAFPEATSYVIDQERRERYNQQNLHFETMNYLAFTYLPPNDAEAKFGEVMISGKKQSAQISYTHHLRRFNHLVERFVSEIGSKLKFSRLNADECYSLLYGCITGNFLKLKIHNPVVDLDYMLGGAADVVTNLKLRINDKYVRILTITDLPDRTRPAILDALTKLRFEFRWNTRYIILDTEDGDTITRRRHKTWFGKRTTAKQLVGQSIGAADAVQSKESIGNIGAEVIADATVNAILDNSLGKEKNGFYTSTIIIFDDNLESIEEKVKLVEKTLNDAFFVTIDESINAFFAYLGSHPGNGAANIRIPVVSTKVLSDLIPWNSVWSGLDINPNPLLVEKGINNPPLLQCVTSGGQPFRHSLHVEEFGNALVTGPSGGLEVYLNLVALQALKYRHTHVYFFDKQKKSMAACLGVGGQFYDIGDSKNDVHFQPLRELETLQQLQLAKTFIKLLCEIKIKGFTILTTEQEKYIDDILNLLTVKPVTQRTLSNFVTLMMPKDQEIGRAVQYYTSTGPFVLLFDSNDVPASFIHARMASFELEYLNNQFGPEALVPLIVYIFNKLKIELFYKKLPIYIIIYDCWKDLVSEKFAHYLEDILRTGTTNNVSLILATGEPSDILNSSMRNLIISQCQTKIFLPNPDAMNSINYTVYQTFGLSNKQTSIIASAIGKRQFFYSSPYGKRLFELDICDYTKCFVNTHDPILAKEIYLQDKELFAYNWVKHFAVKHDNKTLHNWADYWLKINAKYNNQFKDFNDGTY